MFERLKGRIKFDDIELVNFVILSEEEKKMVLKWRNHPRVRKWVYHSKMIKLAEHLRFIDSLKNDSKNFYFLVKERERSIGIIYLNRVDFENKNAYLGLYTNPLDKRGYGMVLGESLLKLAFEVLKLHTLKLEVIENNERAISLYKRLGFVEEGKLREFVFRDGKWRDVIVMGMTKEEYEGGSVCKKR